MIIRKKTFEDMKDKLMAYEHRIKLLEDQSGLGKIKRLMKMIEDLEMDPHDEEVQTIKKIVFFDVAGNDSKILKGYSQGTFIKEMGKDTLSTLEGMQAKYNLLSKPEDKKRLKK